MKTKSIELNYNNGLTVRFNEGMYTTTIKDILYDVPKPDTTKDRLISAWIYGEDQDGAGACEHMSIDIDRLYDGQVIVYIFRHQSKVMKADTNITYVLQEFYEQILNKYTQTT